MNKLATALWLALGLVITSVVVVSAGGWAIVTLDQLPGTVIANEPAVVGFMVYQHGITPTNDFQPVVFVEKQDGIESFRVDPVQEGVRGHYRATLTFPSAGVWKWNIRTVSLRQPMPTLTVLPAAPGQSAPEPQVTVNGPALAPSVVGGLGALLFIGTGVVWWLNRRRWGPAVGTVVLLVAALGIVLVAAALSQTAVAARPAPIKVQQVNSADAVQTGRALFLAKGCVICHQDLAVAEERQMVGMSGFGPDLSKLSAEPEYLRKWLHNPADIRPGAQMPNLHLSTDEIEALVAFLTARGQ